MRFIKNTLAFGGLGVFCLSLYQLAWGTVTPSLTEETLVSIPSLETNPEELVADDGSLVIVLDPGHGGKDPGTHRGEVIEKELNMDVARRVRKRLEKRGMRVVMTRSGDHEIELSERAAIGNRYKNALFVSVHHNATTSSPLAQGVETFFCWPKPASVMRRQREIYGLGADSEHEDERSRMLAERVQEAFCATTGANDRGTKNKGFLVTRMVHGPSVLVECGFITNPDEKEKLMSERYRERIADGIAAGILKYADESGGDPLYGIYFPHGAPTIAVK